MGTLNYFDAADIPGIRRDYPIGAAFLDRFRRMSRDELRALQEQRFLEVLAFAWKVPFYQRHWGNQGIAPGDIRGLDDIALLPTYSKVDLMASVEQNPPLGNFDGQSAHPAEARPQIIIQTTSGTTGRPQPLLYGPRSREIQNAILARTYLLQGINSDDVVHSVYGFGLVNGGHFVRETVSHWVGACLLSAGTGVETRSAQQVVLMRDFGATALVGFGDFLRRLAEVAREQGIEPGRDIRLRLISGHLGPEGREPISAVWGGCRVFDWYGVGDTGWIAGEGPDMDGLHVMEDVHYMELISSDTGKTVEVGDPGDIVCTCLYKNDIFPIIRFNTHDVTEEMGGLSALELPFRRILGFRGRSDNMVKLRGINVFPSAIGALLTAEASDYAGDFLCELSREGTRDEMTVFVEVRHPSNFELVECYQALFRSRLGVDLTVRLCPAGSLADRTGVESRQKPIRLFDLRKA